MTIIPYCDNYEEDVKDLLLQLQIFLSVLDSEHVLTVKENYRDAYFAHTMQEMQTVPSAAILAVDDGKAIGVALCKIMPPSAESRITTTCPKTGFISDLVVSEPHRRKGVGRALLSAAERFFRENGCARYQLCVFAPNKGAIEFYRSTGMTDNCLFLDKKL